jgi:hypothetical protein
MLHDPATVKTAKGPPPKAICQPNGDFAFNTYVQGDGVRAGKYVLTIAELRHAPRMGYVGPDALKNLFNDPDANAKVDEFVIDHQPPGRTDYVFDLRVEGREPATPGPNAITKLHH